MLIQCDSLHTVEELPTHQELRIAFLKADKEFWRTANALDAEFSHEALHAYGAAITVFESAVEALMADTRSMASDISHFIVE